MISKIAPLMVLGMAAQSYYNKSGKKKPKEILIDPNTGKEMKKAVQKKKLEKNKGK